MSKISYGAPQLRQRYCSHHGTPAPIDGGAYFVYAKGTRRRWVCAGCRPKYPESALRPEDKYG